MLGGFTLIELSIVLVIIGLIVGGVLVGQDLIRAAEVRSVLTDVERFNTAANTFIGKYGCLPGDCANATTFWPVNPNCSGWDGNPTPTEGTCNGNGNGIIEMDGDSGGGTIANSNTQAFYHDEAHLFWQHLALAGLIPGAYTGYNPGWVYSVPGFNVPASRIPNGCYSMLNIQGVETSFAGQLYGPSWGKPATLSGAVYWFGAVVYNYGTYFNCGGPLLTPIEAKSIDSKVDDGLPFSGNVQAPAFFGAPYNSTCTNVAISTNYDYLTTYTGPQCQLVFKVGF